MACLHSNRESRSISATRYFSQTRPLATAAGCATRDSSPRCKFRCAYGRSYVHRRFDPSTTSNLSTDPSLQAVTQFCVIHDDSHDILGTTIAMLATAYILLTIKVSVYSPFPTPDRASACKSCSTGIRTSVCGSCTSVSGFCLAPIPSPPSPFFGFDILTETNNKYGFSRVRQGVVAHLRPC